MNPDNISISTLLVILITTGTVSVLLKVVESIVSKWIDKSSSKDVFNVTARVSLEKEIEELTIQLKDFRGRELSALKDRITHLETENMVLVEANKTLTNRVVELEIQNAHWAAKYGED